MHALIRELVRFLSELVRFGLVRALMTFFTSDVNKTICPRNKEEAAESGRQREEEEREQGQNK